MRHKGFTLIELLVVIAIIAILAAVVFPVFASAKERGRQTQCASSIRQIGIAWTYYLEDSDDYYPRIGTLGDFKPFIRSYIPQKGRGIWFCPSDPLPEYLHDFASRSEAAFTAYYSSYLASGQFFSTLGDACQDEYNYPRSHSTVKEPDQIIVSFEDGRETVAQDHFFPWFSSFLTKPRKGDMAANSLLWRGAFHSGKGNYLFADGHVRSLSLRRTLSPKVLWDNLRDWTESTCSHYYAWDQQDIEQQLEVMDKVRQPR